MKENEAHSPLPFRAKSTLVLDMNGLIVADTYRTVPAKKRDQEAKNEVNAAFIVQCVNSYTALLEAAKQMSCTCSNPDGSWPHNENNAECNLTIAAAAIALAEKDQPS